MFQRVTRNLLKPIKKTKGFLSHFKPKDFSKKQNSALLIPDINMYCRYCGNKLDERTRKCPHDLCNGVIPNIYLGLYCWHCTSCGKYDPGDDKHYQMCDKCSKRNVMARCKRCRRTTRNRSAICDGCKKWRRTLVTTARFYDMVQALLSHVSKQF